MPVKRAWCRSQADSNSANMAANPPETGIPLKAAGWFLRCKPAQSPLKDVFSVRLRPLASVDHILYQKLLRDVGVYTFVGENWPSSV